jgi:hypothetical protein
VCFAFRVLDSDKGESIMLTKFFELILGDVYGEMESGDRLKLSLATIIGGSLIISIILLLNGDMIEDIFSLLLIGAAGYYILNNKVGLGIEVDGRKLISLNEHEEKVTSESAKQTPSVVTKITGAPSNRSTDDSKVL